MVRLAAVALVALAACGTPALDGAEAAGLARDAFAAAGIDAAARGPAAAEPDGAWLVPLDVDGAAIEVTVATDRVVATAELDGPVLSERSARAIADFRRDRATPVGTRVVGLLAVAGLLALGYLALRRAARADRAAQHGPLVGRLRFAGQICGFGAGSGHRFVVGRWTGSPLGPFADVMHETPDGTRRLLAPTRAVADVISSTYQFDEIVVTECTARQVGRTLQVQVGGLELELEVGSRSGLGWLLRLVPRRVATAPSWCRAIGPLARRVLPGVRTSGSAGGGRREFYGATDHRRVVALRASLDGQDLGGLHDLWPPVRFGFGSAPRRPSLVEVVTTVDVPVPGAVSRRRPPPSKRS